MKKQYSSATSTHHHQGNRQPGFDSQTDLRPGLQATWLPELSARHLNLNEQPELLPLQPSPQCLSSSTLIPPTQTTSTHLCQPGGHPPARMQPHANRKAAPGERSAGVCTCPGTAAREGACRTALPGPRRLSQEDSGAVLLLRPRPRGRVWKPPVTEQNRQQLSAKENTPMDLQCHSQGSCSPCPLQFPRSCGDLPCSAWPTTRGWAALGQPLLPASSPPLPWLRGPPGSREMQADGSQLHTEHSEQEELWATAAYSGGPRPTSKPYFKRQFPGKRIKIIGPPGRAWICCSKWRHLLP